MTVTDEDLARLEERLEEVEIPNLWIECIQRLIAEVRRLREKLKEGRRGWRLAVEGWDRDRANAEQDRIAGLEAVKAYDAEIDRLRGHMAEMRRLIANAGVMDSAGSTLTMLAIGHVLMQAEREEVGDAG